MATQAYDIVFIDPPFMQQLVGPICEALTKKQLLSNDALVYVETGAMEPPARSSVRLENTPREGCRWRGVPPVQR